MREDEESWAEWPFAVELAAMPQVWAALLELHVSGRDGRCRGCRSQVRIAALAVHALPRRRPCAPHRRSAP